MSNQDVQWREDMPAAYDTGLGDALFRPYARHLAAIARELHPDRVLELAAGTGILTAELVTALPGAAITATDLNPPMVAWAAEHVPGAQWQVADAQHLDLPDGSFDLVACQFGAMFFPDRPAGYAEVARVLRPGGVARSQCGPAARLRRVRGQDADHGTGIVQLTAKHRLVSLVKINPADRHTPFLAVAAEALVVVDLCQVPRQEDAKGLGAAARRTEVVDENVPAACAQVGFLMELASRRLPGWLACDVEQTGRHLPLEGTDGMAVLLDE